MKFCDYVSPGHYPKLPRRLIPAVLLVVSAAAFLAPPAAAQSEELYEPLAVYLTWQRDPSTTMTVHWHTFEEEGRQSSVEWRTEGVETWSAQSGSSEEFRFSDPKRLVHTAELTGLEPATRYNFRFGGDSAEFSFRTMPATLEAPIRFAEGGDLDFSMETVGKMNRVAARMNIDFVVWGGDLAYANGDPRLIDKWHTFFEVAKETLVTPDGRTIPMLVAVGNHELFNAQREEVQELNKEWGLEHREPTFFFNLFSFPGRPSYNVLDFGDYLSIVLLDTGHVSPIDGEQVAWLASTLEARRHVTHVLPVYHVPAYPSYRPYRFEENRLIRQHWVPLFEANKLRLVFENHDHTYKRTHPLKDGEIDPDGVVYLGDGAWGAGKREPSVREGTETWYLVKAASVNHGYIVTLYPDQRHVLAVDNEGNVFDELYQRLN